MKRWRKRGLARSWTKCKPPTPQGHGLSGALQVTVHPRTTSHAYIVAQYFDIPRSVEVGVARPATGGIGARKALALPRAQMQTPIAHLGCIRRWHQMQD